MDASVARKVQWTMRLGPTCLMHSMFLTGAYPQFHTMREKHPERFSSRARNKMWYAELGASELWQRSCENLHKKIQIEVCSAPC